MKYYFESRDFVSCTAKLMRRNETVLPYFASIFLSNNNIITNYIRYRAAVYHQIIRIVLQLYTWAGEHMVYSGISTKDSELKYY